jgi:hypothetical protein
VVTALLKDVTAVGSVTNGSAVYNENPGPASSRGFSRGCGCRGTGATFLILLQFPYSRISGLARSFGESPLFQLDGSGRPVMTMPHAVVGVLVRDSDIAAGRSASVWSEI